MNTPDTPDPALGRYPDESDEHAFNAEAYFTITAPNKATAETALAVAVGSCDEALRHIGLHEDFPGGCTISLSLEDEHGRVEED